MKSFQEFLTEDTLNEAKVDKKTDGSSLVKQAEKELNEIKSGVEAAKLIIKVTERTEAASQIQKYGITKEDDDIVLSVKFKRNPDDELMNKAFMLIDNHRYAKNASRTVKGYDESFIIKER